MIKLSTYGFEYMTPRTAKRIAKNDFMLELFETRQNIFEHAYSPNQIKRIFTLQFDEYCRIAKETKKEIPNQNNEMKKNYQVQYSYYKTLANLTQKYIKKLHLQNEPKFKNIQDFFWGH